MFDELKRLGTAMDDERMARMVRYMPSLGARRHFRVPHAVLLVMLWISVVAKSLAGFAIVAEQGWTRWPAILLLPSVTLVFAVLVAMSRTRAYHTVAFLAGYGLLKGLLRLRSEVADTWDAIDLVFAAGMLALAWYLFAKVASNFEVMTDAEGGTRVVFPPEPGDVRA